MFVIAFFFKNFNPFIDCRCLVAIKVFRLVKTSHRSYCEGLIMCLTMRNSWLQCCQFINGGGQPQGREYSHLVVVRLVLIPVQHCPRQLNLQSREIQLFLEWNAMLCSAFSNQALRLILYAHAWYRLSTMSFTTTTGRQKYNPNGRQPLCCNHQRNSHLVTFHYCCLRPILSQGLKQRMNTFELPTVYLSFSGDTALPSGSKKKKKLVHTAVRLNIMYIV